MKPTGVKRWIIVFLILLSARLAAAQPNILDPPFVTDVTPRSFAAVWISSAPADPSLRIYDENGTEITDLLRQTAFPTLSPSQVLIGYARSAGMLKVSVSGLLPDTTYRFQTVTTTAEGNTTYPQVSFLSVRTEKGSSVLRPGSEKLPGSGDLALFQVFRPDGTTPARGSLLVAWTTGAAYPISAYIGDGSSGGGSEPGLVTLDLNNFYDTTSHESLIVDGPAILKLKALRGNGSQGSALLHYRRIPAASGSVSVLTPQRCHLTDINCDGAVDLYDATLFTGNWGLSTGDSAFNGDYDFNDDHGVDGNDNTIFRADYGKSAPF